VNHEELRALSLIQLRDAIAAGEVTAEQATRAAIEQADSFRDRFALFVTYTPERALADAITADKHRAAGKPLGPLHGVPITIKDNIDVAGVRATAGSRVLADRVPAEDAVVVAKLKAAGAIVTLGQTNLHEMAMGGTSTNVHYGAVRNPWDPERIPGGSSGGAAACLSLQIGHAALGTDAGGSVRGPASLCGVVGLKQTHGLVPLKGIVAAGNWTVDHIGPLTRNVADARVLLELIQGHEPDDPESSTRPAEPYSPITDLKGIRVGLPETYFWEQLDSEVEAVCRKAVVLMQEAGAEIVPLKLETIELLEAARKTMVAVDALVFHEPYLQAHPELYGEELRHRLMASQYVLATDYVRAQRVRRLWTEECSRTLAAVDILASPTRSAPAHLIGETPTSSRNTSPFNQSGVPAISIPAGLTSGGLPVGLQLAAAAFQDYKLIEIASVVERLIGFDPTPPALKMAAAAR
jgi:aspartyl-tRNA(Asn)/glutamyl-tRNA(Gln) amidotransferase subunit A